MERAEWVGSQVESPVVVAVVEAMHVEVLLVEAGLFENQKFHA